MEATTALAGDNVAIEKGRAREGRARTVGRGDHKPRVRSRHGAEVYSYTYTHPYMYIYIYIYLYLYTCAVISRCCQAVLSRRKYKLPLYEGARPSVRCALRVARRRRTLAHGLVVTWHTGPCFRAARKLPAAPFPTHGGKSSNTRLKHTLSSSPTSGSLLLISRTTSSENLASSSRQRSMKARKHTAACTQRGGPFRLCCH